MWTVESIRDETPPLSRKLIERVETEFLPMWQRWGNRFILHDRAPGLDAVRVDDNDYLHVTGPREIVTSHALGTYGPAGAGICAQFGLTDRVHFITASLAKTMAGRAGFFTLRNEMEARGIFGAVFGPPATSKNLIQAMGEIAPIVRPWNLGIARRSPYQTIDDVGRHAA